MNTYKIYRNKILLISSKFKNYKANYTNNKDNMKNK